jgi:hypothetical protein
MRLVLKRNLKKASSGLENAFHAGSNPRAFLGTALEVSAPILGARLRETGNELGFGVHVEDDGLRGVTAALAFVISGVFPIATIAAGFGLDRRGSLCVHSVCKSNCVRSIRQ